MRLQPLIIPLALAGALLYWGVLAAQAPAAPAAEQERVTVRVSAHVSQTGRVQVGLQQRLRDGWGPRILPAGRYFPADATPGVWYFTRGFHVVTGGADMGPNPSPASLLVGIRAQQTAGGALRLGVVQWTGGGWGEPPRLHRLRSTAPRGRWLNARAVHLSVPPPPAPADAGAWDVDKSIGRAALESTAVADPDVLVLSCVEASPGDLPVVVVRTGAHIADSRMIEQFRVDYQVEEGLPVSGATWENLTIRIESAQTYPGMAAADPAGFTAWLAVNYEQGRTLHLTVKAAESPGDPYTVRHRASFDLTGLPAVLADLPCFGVGGG
ncbi:MAG: hypothetical protein F4Y94_05995 [Chloroflexi bacterium]|nr:hypothetical protein [Chloroflexota bacterium]